MALTALCETSHESSRMRGTVTALAGGYHFMFVLVAGNTSNTFMLGVCLGMLFEWFFVTGAAHLVRRIRAVNYSSRHMSLMAAFTVGNDHFRTMWLVTLGTEWDLTMNIMTESTGKLGVLAWRLLKFCYLSSVTGKTFIGYIVGQFYDLRGMRIAVTAQTAGQLIMRFVSMTHAAIRNVTLRNRPMTSMAVLARYA